MTIADLITYRVQQIMDEKASVFYGASGNCLRVTRETLAPIFGFEVGDAQGFYEHFLRYEDRVSEHASSQDAPWARDMQRALRRRGWQIPFVYRQGGDIVFSAELAFPIGHVGILLAKDFLFENTSTERGSLVKGFNRLSHLSEQKHYDKLEVYRPRF